MRSRQCLSSGFSAQGAAPTARRRRLRRPPVPETFNGYLTAGTQVSRAVVLTQASTLTATLNSTDPSGVQVGLGLGLLDGSDCALTQVITAGAGGSLSVATDAGTYCVDLYDIGQVGKAPLSFTVTIDHH